jgi:hypothetical protein
MLPAVRANTSLRRLDLGYPRWLAIDEAEKFVRQRAAAE